MRHGESGAGGSPAAGRPCAYLSRVRRGHLIGAWDSVGAAATIFRGLLAAAQGRLATCQLAAARMAQTGNGRQWRGRRFVRRGGPTGPPAGPPLRRGGGPPAARRLPRRIRAVDSDGRAAGHCMVDYGTPRGVTLLTVALLTSRPACEEPASLAAPADQARSSRLGRLERGDPPAAGTRGGRTADARSGFAGPVGVGCETAAALGNAGRAANAATAR